MTKEETHREGAVETGATAAAAAPAAIPGRRLAAIVAATAVAVPLAELVGLFMAIATADSLGNVETHWRPLALGFGATLGTLLSLGILAALMRWLGGVTPAHGDVAGAVVAACLLGAWTVAVFSWNQDRAGYIEPDWLGLGARLWAPIVVGATLLLVLARSSGRAAPVVRSAALILVALLAAETTVSALGAFEDGSVSVAGGFAGAAAIAQIVFLAAWAVRGFRA